MKKGYQSKNYQELVRTSFDGCLKNSLKRGMSILSFNGGFINPPPTLNSMEIADGFPVLILYDKGDFETLTITEVEDELEDFVSNDVYSCLRNTEDELYNEEGLIINDNGEEPLVNVEVTHNSVVADLSYPIEVNYKNDVIHINNFGTKVDVKLGRIIKQINSIVDDLTVNDFYSNKKVITDTIGPYLAVYPDISLSFITDHQIDLYTEYWIYNQDTVIWIVYDAVNKNEVDDNTYRIIFASKGLPKLNPELYTPLPSP